MLIPLNRLGIEWNPCSQGKGRIRFYNVETEKADRSLRKSAGAVESWWYESQPDDLALTFWLYYAMCYALIDGVDRTLIDRRFTDRVGKIRHSEANEFSPLFMYLPTYCPPLPSTPASELPPIPEYSTAAMLAALRGSQSRDLAAACSGPTPEPKENAC